MSAPDFSSTPWRKSSRSNDTGACVEIATVSYATAVRDSKLGQQSPIIAIDQHSWAGFLNHLKRTAS